VTQPAIRIRLNGEWRELSVAPNDLLLNTLREQEQLTGTKYGCGIGECGACTVHVDGQPVLACLTLTVAVSGCEVRTIEGLADGGRLDPVQEAFLDTAAVQCGFCTSGMVMMGRALLDDNPKPTESEIREHLKGILCRCTGYASIVRALLRASAMQGRAAVTPGGSA
jgi:carbon-monoxide dehydrogenase small subunit